MRLIDADALIEAIDEINWYSFYKGCLVNGAECEEKALYKAVDIIAAVDNEPTIEAEPVRHGVWSTGYYNYEGVYVRDCSYCGYAHDDLSPYCPSCGAKMDGDSHE